MRLSGARDLHGFGGARSVLRSASAVVIALCTAHEIYAAAATDLGVRVVATSFRAGTTGLYSVSVTNRGADTDVAVHVNATLPNGLTFLSGGGAGVNCTAAGQVLDCNLGIVRSAGSVGFRVLVRVGSEAVPRVSTSFVLAYPGDTNGANNTATRIVIVKRGRIPAATPTLAVNTPTPPGPTPTFTFTRTPTPSPIGTATPIPIATDLMLTVTGAGTFTVGGRPSYLLTVTNLGSSATNVPMTILDTLPGGISFVSATGEGWTCAGEPRIVNCINPAPLQPTGSTSLVLAVRVGEEAYPTVTNLVSLVYAADTDLSNNSARRPTTVRRPRPGSAAPGTATPATAAPDTTPTRTATALAATATPGTVAAADLLLANTVNGALRVGSQGRYTLTVRNDGPDDTNAPVTVVDTLPAGLGLAAADTSEGFTCTTAGQEVSCTRAAAVATGSSAVVILSVNVGSAAFPTVTNSATVFYAGDPDSSNNVAKRPTTVKR
jgi:uncharacterized repeat protein (TIGR01451 family)